MELGLPFLLGYLIDWLGAGIERESRVQLGEWEKRVDLWKALRSDLMAAREKFMKGV